MSGELRRWHVLTTASVLGLAAVSALLGLFRPGHYRDAPGLVESYQMQDLTILLVGIPVLAGGLRYAMRGSPRGRVVWLGGLAYMTYTWASIAVQITFNELFLVYVALFGLSLFTLVGGFVTTDAGAIRGAVEGRIRPSLYSGSLILVGLGLAALWLSDIVPALLDGTIPLLAEEAGPQAMVSHVIDLGVVVPAILLAAAWLYQRRTWGFVLAGVVLILGATLAASISLMTLVLGGGDAVTVSPVAAFFSLVPVIVAAVLAVTYVHSMRSDGRSPADDRRRQTA
jgi:hypothetical protein